MTVAGLAATGAERYFCKETKKHYWCNGVSLSYYFIAKRFAVKVDQIIPIDDLYYHIFLAFYPRQMPRLLLSHIKATKIFLPDGDFIFILALFFEVSSSIRH